MMFSLSFVGGGGVQMRSASGFGPEESISANGFGPGGPNHWDTGVGKRIVMFKGFFANIGGKFISHQN